MKIIKIKTEADLETLNKMKHEIFRKFFQEKRGYISFTKFEDIARVVMSQGTMAALEAVLTYHWPEGRSTILGMKILIDDEIPYGECEIFINALEVC